MQGEIGRGMHAWNTHRILIWPGFGVYKIELVDLPTCLPVYLSGTHTTGDNCAYHSPSCMLVPTQPIPHTEPELKLTHRIPQCVAGKAGARSRSAGSWGRAGLGVFSGTGMYSRPLSGERGPWVHGMLCSAGLRWMFAGWFHTSGGRNTGRGTGGCVQGEEKGRRGVYKTKSSDALFYAIRTFGLEDCASSPPCRSAPERVRCSAGLGYLRSWKLRFGSVRVGRRSSMGVRAGGISCLFEWFQGEDLG